jgi:hypothetical protein
MTGRIGKKIHLHVGQVQRMAHGDQVGGLFGRHHPGDAGRLHTFPLDTVPAAMRWKVSADMWTMAWATAVRRVVFFSVTSTMRTRPLSSMWVSSDISPSCRWSCSQAKNSVLAVTVVLMALRVSVRDCDYIFTDVPGHHQHHHIIPNGKIGVGAISTWISTIPGRDRCSASTFANRSRSTVTRRPVTFRPSRDVPRTTPLWHRIMPSWSRAGCFFIFAISWFVFMFPLNFQCC